MACTQKYKSFAGFLIAALFAGLLSSIFISSADADDLQSKINPALGIQGCTKMRIGGADGWEPITYTNSDGVPSGLGIDILRAYGQQHGIALEILLDIPWTRSIQMLENGELDVIAGAYFTQKRSIVHAYSAPFAHDDVMVFQYRKNLFRMTGIHDLIGLRGARPQGGSYGDYVDTYAQQRLDMIYSPTGNRIFDVLKNGRADYVMLGRYDGLANIYKDNLQGEVIAIEPPLVSNEVALMFSRKSPCARHVENINLLIEKLNEEGEIEQWTMRHLGGIHENIKNETQADNS